MRVALLGDVALFGKYSLSSNPNAKERLREAAHYLSDFDCVIANLETPFVTNQRPYAPKSAHIKSSPEDVELLKYLNIGYVNLANNHIYDFGPESLALTINILEKNSIEHFGIDGKQVKITRNDCKMALSGYCCYSTNPLGLDRGVNPLDIERVTNDMISNHKNGFYNLLNVHFGQEHVHQPNYDHILMARQLAHELPYVFCGHHPHVIQGLEQHLDSFIAYSLGNFCFDDVYTNSSSKPIFKMTEANRKSFIWDIEIKDNVVVNHRMMPVYVGKARIELGDDDIANDIQTYSKYLESALDSEYVAIRKAALQKYISQRKTKRDLVWYFDRLSVDSVTRLINIRHNRNMYKRLISNKIKL